MENNKYKALESEIRDLLNQAMIKLGEVKKFKSEFYDYGERPIDPLNTYKYNRETEQEETVVISEELKSEVYLSCVKNWLERALSEGDGYKQGVSALVSNENKYYTSTCWG